MAFGGTVACFARDAEFRDVSFDIAVGCVEAGFGSGAVAAAANDVPCFRAVFKLRGADEGGVTRDPAFFGDEPSERKTNLKITSALRDPKHLHVMRAGDEADAGFEAGADAFACDRFHADPEFVGLLEEGKP